jgi:hypothetical protein
LLSFGVDLVDNFRRAAAYVDRILRGAKPAELPVQLPTTATDWDPIKVSLVPVAAEETGTGFRYLPA